MLSRIAPSDNPREVCLGKQAESQSTPDENRHKIYQGYLEGMIEVERFSAFQSQKQERPGPRGVDRASSCSIIGKRAAEFQFFAHHVVAIFARYPSRCV